LKKSPGWEDENVIIDVLPVKYDALKLLTGEYKGKRSYLIVEVKDAVFRRRSHHRKTGNIER
jgi:hypothetical protein